jgi:ABC-type transport system substrate-binding protein
MTRNLRRVLALAGLTIAISAAGPALAQKPGRILRLSHFDSPASMSILEESTRATLQPMMGVFNNLVMYDQHIAKSSLETVVPDLATGWSWSEDGTELTFQLRQVARRQAVHRRRRQMHLGPADGDRQRQAPGQPTQILVQQCHRG